MSDLIDTTEMYLRTLYELLEEGVPLMRARIAERLHQSGPTVSQTVARMERDGLLTVHEDRHIELSEVGFELAENVMRKHRLAERLLTDVIGLEWPLVHEEACRWEHVISEAVEHRLLDILGEPTCSPYGNPIPGLDRLGAAASEEDFRAGSSPLVEVLGDEEIQVEIVRIGESVQSPATLKVLNEVGATPGTAITVRALDRWITVSGPHGEGELDYVAAEKLFVRIR